MEEQSSKPFFYAKNGLFHFLNNSTVRNYYYEQLSPIQLIEQYSQKKSNITDFDVLNDQILLVKKYKELPIEEIKSNLPYGIYTIETDRDDDITLRPSVFKSDRYLELNSNIINEIQENITKFINLKSRYEELEIIHKRGYLLYGPPGNGKSMLLNHIVQNYKDNCYIFYIERASEWYYIDQIKELFEEELTIFVIEELTMQTESSYINNLLNFLDGPFSWDNSIIFATTNYPELLPENIIDRPSRFDMVIKIDNPTEEMRRQYLSQVMGKYPEEIINLTKDHSLAYLKEVCIKTILNGDSLLESYRGFEEFRQYAKNRKNNEVMEYMT